jgi:glycosyltransferase involved in cell wall biosynthesis
MTPRVLTALPVYNEERHLVEVLDSVKQYAQDILVVDDGSSDATGEVLSSIDGIVVRTHEVNQGYGAALRTAFCYAIENDYDIVVTIDCDGQHEPSLIPKIAAEVFPEHGEPFDIVSGSRYLKKFDAASIPPEDRRRVNVEITKRINELFDFGITDAFCGFKAYRTLPLERLRITELGYAMPLQLWVQSHRLGFRLTEFPVPLVYLDEERSFGGSLDDTNRRLSYYRQVLDRELAEFAVNEPTNSAQTMCD